MRSFVPAFVRRSPAAIAFLALVTVVGSGQQNSTISGVVLDTTGAAIRNASVDLRIDDHVSNTHTDGQGRFVIGLSSFEEFRTAATLVVHAYGFSTKRVEVSLLDHPNGLEMRLEPAPITARIEVEASDQTNELDGETVLSQAQIAHSAAVTIDDALRQVPGFSLFRRSGSLTANPTSQGVSLRGVGANGASRAVVLLDGVPLNSPFGSWIFWSRVPRVAIENARVINGATSDAYGSGALGGVINIESRQVEEPFFETDLSLGNLGTAAASVVGGTVVHNFGITASAQALRTNGYVLVTNSSRGIVDTAAGTADVSGYFTISRAVRNGRMFLRGNSFGESRRNGTPVQINDTRIWSVDLGVNRRFDTLGDFSARIYGSREVFNQNFSAVSADRNSESLTNRQHNPSQQFGVALQWQRLFAARHLIVAGLEGRDVRGHSAEVTFNASRITANIDAGGRQTIGGAFAQDSLRAGRWLIHVGGRIDRWSNRGFFNRVPVAGIATFTSFPDQVETAFSPRASVSRTVGTGLLITASFYRAFRAPTLNELYRSFRVGTVVTNANPNLRAERLTGGEAGFAFHTFGERLTTRVNFFWSQIAEPIANVTISSTPALITRQRQNLGTVRARGIEADATYKIVESLTWAAQYLLTDTTVLRFPANRAIEGLLVPQIPRRQFSFQLIFSRARWLASVQARATSTQFDDDQNLLPLHPFFTVDAEFSRRFSPQFEIYLAAQNLTAVRYDIGRTPVLTTGPPALLRVGVRLTVR